MTEDAQMKLRLPVALKRMIEAAALEANRSLNGEIVSRLETSFPNYAANATAARRGPRHNTLETRVAALENQLEGLVPDFPAGDKIEALEQRMTKIENRLRALENR